MVRRTGMVKWSGFGIITINLLNVFNIRVIGKIISNRDGELIGLIMDGFMREIGGKVKDVVMEL